MQRGKRSALAGMTAVVAAALLLSGCGSDPEADIAPPSPSTAPSAGTPMPTVAPSAVPSPVVPDGWTVPSTGPVESPNANQDPTWVPDAEYYSWPVKNPDLPADLKDMDPNKVAQAWKTAVIFADAVGWNASLMSDGNAGLATSAMNPYMTGKALNKFDELAPGYQRVNKLVADGVNLVDYSLDPKRTKKEKNDLRDWMWVSSLISYGVPYFTGGDSVTIDANGGTGMGYRVTGLYRNPNNPDGIVVDVAMDKTMDVKGAAHLKDGPVRFSKWTRFYFVPNPNVEGYSDSRYPWVIDEWYTLSNKDGMTTEMFAGDNAEPPYVWFNAI